jgi:ubiquinone/menaquinone biosynthesis C-methylase UbiE
MFSAPEKNIEQLGLKDNMQVADFGTGSGAYAIAAAKAMHGTGKVYAIEVQQELLTRLEHHCADEHLGNVAYIWGNIEVLGGTKMRDGSCDVVIVSNVLFQAPDKKIIIAEARRVLRDGGTLLVIDWTASFNNMGPTAEQVFSESAARALIEGQSFVFVRSLSAGNYHYGLVYTKGIAHV